MLSISGGDDEAWTTTTRNPMLLFLFLGLLLFRAAAFDPALQQGPWEPGLLWGCACCFMHFRVSP